MTTLLTMKGFNKQAQPVTTAGIYHNPSLGLISLSSDGSNWITIADKNLGATQVYNDGDVLSESNCGKYYQWGNNYGFPFTGDVTTSSTQVNASTYGPGNYYNNSVFRNTGMDWSSPSNPNLWGGVTGTNEAMQGPCASGYHIPIDTELNNIFNIGITLGLWSGSNWNGIKKYLKLPISGFRNASLGYADSQGSIGQYWSSIENSNNEYQSKRLLLTSSEINIGASVKAYGSSIRPFSNTPIQPDDGGDWETLYTPPEILNFTANTAGSTIVLNKYRSPTVVTLETSTDGSNWSTYTFGSTITLTNIGDKVYWRNTSETPTGFSTSSGSYYFTMTGSIAASGDVNFLLCKNSTDVIQSQHCFDSLFGSCTSLIKPPRLPATTLQAYCYQSMFSGCTNLEVLPELPATTLQAYCYQYMFATCSKIKLSETQTGEYQTAYRIPSGGSGTVGSNSLKNMFTSTGGTFTGTPSINTTYYTSNTII